VAWKLVSWECLVPSIRDALNPCGVVDVLRRCYVDYVPLVAGDPTLYPIRWYFTDRRPFPWPTQYQAFAVWDWRDQQTRCPPQPLQWDRGVDRCECSGLRGRREWFLTGAEIPPVTDLPEIGLGPGEVLSAGNQTGEDCCAGEDHLEVWWS